jgi:hypothetical protein
VLRPLPPEPFRYYRFGERSVHLDGHVEVEGAYYSVPPGSIGRRVRVQWDELHVRVLSPITGELLREHIRQLPGRYRTRNEDRPARTPPSTVQILENARRAGKSIGLLCEEMHRREGELAVRRIQGVLALARRFGAATVDESCAAALDVGVPNYRFVRRYVERRTPPALALKQVDELIRPLTEYRDLIHQLAERKAR